MADDQPPRTGEEHRMSVIILRGDAANLPLPDASVDLIVTSPPYWNLRDYRDGGESLKGQIGSEATPREWLDALLNCTREWARVLKPEGSMFVDLGDKYSARADSSAKRSGRRDHAGCIAPARNSRSLGRQKSLLLLPERYRIGCVDELDLIARAKIVWSKTTPLPESAEDRVQTTHEDFVHLTRRPTYFSAVDEIRVPHTGNTHARGKLSPKEAATVAAGHRRGFFPEDKENPLGKLPGSVWEVASVPLIVPERVAHARCCGGRRRHGCEDGLEHFAAYPPELVRRIVLGWSPSGICTECGEGRRPVASSVRTFDGQPRDDLPAWADPAAPRRTPNGAGHWRFKTDRRHLGYACACPDISAPTRPAIVLDPFSGTGTTAMTASVLGRIGIGVELSADYCQLARWRTSDPAERARALGVPKPPPVIDGQGDLFDGLETA
jgi:SAM-dependent methyltransferase